MDTDFDHERSICPTPGKGNLTIVRLEQVDSTNKEAQRRLAASAQAQRRPFMVIAGIQTQGEGRRGGATWESPCGGLWATVATPLPERSPVLEGLGLRLGLACLRTVRSAGGLALDARLKWPNDILLGSRKVCGCMARLLTVDGQSWILAAAGINVNNAIPAELGHSATSIREAIGTEVSLDGLEREFQDQFCWALSTHGVDAEILSDANDTLSGIGGRVRMSDQGRIIEGMFMGLGPGGTPRVRTDAGEVDLSQAAETLHDE